MIDSKNSLIYRGEEARDFDYKAPCAWNEGDKKACVELTKDVLAMANTVGGFIVIGVDEHAQGYGFTGLQPDQIKTWETTRLNNFLNSYTEPPINCALKKVKSEGRLFAVIQVPPFSYIPHITTKDFPNSLRRATIYVRTANNASAPIDNATDFMLLVERAIKIRRGEMLEAVLVILPELDKALADKADKIADEQERSQVMRRAERAAPVLKGAQILWVDDFPDNNLHERKILRSLGVFVDLAHSTDEAISMLRRTRYDLVISDMARDGLSDAGIRLLTDMRRLDLHRPTIFYVSSFSESRPVPLHAFGITARPDHLLHFVMDVLERER